MQATKIGGREQALAFAAIIFLIGLALGGGSSRSDMIQFALTQVGAVLLLAVAVLQAPRIDQAAMRLPLMFFTFIAVLMMAQLVPLPPSLWQGLPGRELYGTVADAAGIEQPWRPISLSPDRTVDSLLSLLPIAAVIACFIAMPRRWSRWMMVALVVIAALSSLLAAFQLSEGPSSGLRFYRVTAPDAGVGLLANRNHQATLLAMAIPAAVWWGVDGYLRRRSYVPAMVGVALVALFLAGAILTGSRSGLAACAISVALSLGLTIPLVRRIPLTRLLIAGGIGAVALAALGYFLVADNSGLSRGLEDEPRFWIWPRVIEAIETFFPVGSGWGTFDAVFPRFELVADLTPEYVNRAHSDFLEVLMDAGVFGAALIAAFLVWFAISTWRVWRTGREDSAEMLVARATSIMILLAIVGSVTDYPVRTAMIGSILTAACLILNRSAWRPASHHRHSG